MNLTQTSPSRARVAARGLVGLATVGVGAWGLQRVQNPLGFLYIFIFLVHWLVWYPRWICRYCAHYGRVCPSWGGKISALLYDRPGDSADPDRFRPAKKLGHLTGIALRAGAIVVLAAAVSGPFREDAGAWAALVALAALGYADGALYFGRVCAGCRMRDHCSVRWGRPGEGYES